MQPLQLNPELKAYIDEIMPDIDEAFTASHIPIHDRFMRASIVFVENYIESKSGSDTVLVVKHFAA